VLSACADGYQNCDAQDANGCECAGTGCCAGGCQTQHSNGVGQSFFDCVAAGTHTVAQATAACAAFTGDASQCHASTPCGSAVCSDGSTTACDCGFYGGLDNGKVSSARAGSCSCNARGSDPTWN
jgi:hypothetical protein